MGKLFIEILLNIVITALQIIDISIYVYSYLCLYQQK